MIRNIKVITLCQIRTIKVTSHFYPFFKAPDGFLHNRKLNYFTFVSLRPQEFYCVSHSSSS